METTITHQGLEKSEEDQNPQQSNDLAVKTESLEEGRRKRRAWCPDVGSTFGRLTVVSIIDQKGRKIYTNCDCACGKTTKVVAYALLVGNTSSCGCLKKELLAKRRQTHALSHTPEYKAWKTMKARCSNPKHHAYHRYGGRGITVCKEWKESFSAFTRDMGRRPEGMTIDRKENDKGYFKENCHWVSVKTQARNRSNNHVLTMNGESHCINEWAEILGIHHGKIRERLSRGCPVERALSTKKLHKHSK